MARLQVFLVLIVFVVSAALLRQAASAEELSSVPVYSVTEVVFTGPHQSAADVPARDVQLAVCFRHENGSPEFTVQGFFDDDGQGGVDGDVFKVRFCPTRNGKWTITDVKSNARESTGQHRGDYVTATESKRHGFWILDDEIAGQHWYRRSDGSHQYVIGNTHYTFLTAHGLNGKPTGGHIIADMVANAKYFKEVRIRWKSRGWMTMADLPTTGTTRIGPVCAGFIIASTSRCAALSTMT